MKAIKIILFLFASVLPILGQRQGLSIPSNIERAYSKETRSFDGKPGKYYWQNMVDYTIEVNLEPEQGMITGKSEVVYHNNSPNSLDRLVIRLYQDIYKKGAERDFAINPLDIHDGVLIKNLMIAGENIDLNPPDASVHRTSTNLIISLKGKIPPKTKTDLEIEWSFRLPERSQVRMGKYSESDIFVAYWYPQISVYDDIEGWDLKEYTGYTEFYNEFSDFDVTVNLPGDYLVWATGVLQNPEQVYHENVLRNYLLAQNSNEVIQVVNNEDYAENRVTVKNDINSWRFIAENVTDFSFAVSNNYLWDAVSVLVDTIDRRSVTVNAVYPIGMRHFDRVAYFSKITLEYLSFELPGIPFPYPQMTTFCNRRGGGGMETPMMANNGAPESEDRVLGLTFHEIAHTYFPFLMGNNERKYSWMDEGWATFLPLETIKKFGKEFDYISSTLSYSVDILGTENDVPIITPSFLLGENTARTAWYTKPFFAYMYLQDLLGKELFKEALQSYINTWRGKHPIPYDFFFTFDRIAGEDLSWFWNSWFFERGYVDFALENVSQDGDSIYFEISKEGNMPAPLRVAVFFADGSSEILYKNIGEWKTKTRLRVNLVNSKKLKSVQLLNFDTPDINSNNDIFILGE